MDTKNRRSDHVTVFCILSVLAFDACRDELEPRLPGTRLVIVSQCNRKSSKPVLLVTSTTLDEWTSLTRHLILCMIHGFLRSQISTFGYCSCDQEWSGSHELNIYCVYGSQSFITLHLFDHVYDRACPRDSTGSNLEYCLNDDGRYYGRWLS